MNPRKHRRRAGFVQLGIALACTVTGAQAQTQVITLGTQGGPIMSATRSQPANAVVVGDRIYLVDAGNGVARQLVSAGFDIRNVSRIFITHNHDDHNADWGTLMGLQWSVIPKGETWVYGPVGTQRMLDGFLQYFEPNARIRMGDSSAYRDPRQFMHAQDIQGPGLVYQDDKVSVTASENCHFVHDDQTQRRGDDKSYAFRIKTPDRDIVFSGDTGECPPLVEFSRGADLLVHEVVNIEAIERDVKRNLPPAAASNIMRHMRQEHTTPEDVGRLAQAAGVGEVVLTHVVAGTADAPDSLYVDGVKQHFRGKVTVARDLMKF